ncbi:alix-SF [Aphelenchoides avenae]|nr:alix-SF [Aphelenchus avenae]
MVNFLSVPLKSTNEVDLIKPLQNYVATILDAGSDLTMEINEGIVELNKLRNRACNQPLDKSQSSLDLLTRYYDQLCVIENKLPISATLNPISFKWKDAFDKGSLFFSRASLTISDASFERAAVLFNSGALMSAIASSQPHNTDEELKATARLFQQAAGVFSKLKDTVLGMVQQEPTPDLMPDTLAALSALMVAQAQESVYTKASKDQMKPQSLAKIAAQCAEFYQDAQKFMARDVVKGIWDKEWLNTVAGKSLAYNALAQFQQAEACGESKDIGEQLSRLKEADKLMEQSKTYVPSGTFGTEQALIKKSLAQATKDNDFLYHERVPDFKTLPLLPKAALAKPLPVNFPLSPRFKDLFESLVPVQVQSALSTFEARKAELINVETGRMREYTQVMNAQLASINLPAALDDATNHEKCPESIRQKSSKVKSAGGLEAIQSKLSDLPGLFKRNEEILTETSRLLREEKENDESLRRQFGAKWTRVQSDQLTAPLQQELGKYRGILTTATNADAIVAKKFEDNRRAIDLLSKPEIELANAIPSISANGDGGNSEAVRQLRSCMERVQEIKVEREALEKQLKEARVRFDMSNDFLKSMSENGVVNEEKLSSDKITELYGPLKDRVNQSIKRQEEVMSEVQRWNTAFVQEKGSGGVDREPR